MKTGLGMWVETVLLRYSIKSGAHQSLTGWALHFRTFWATDELSKIWISIINRIFKMLPITTKEAIAERFKRVFVSAIATFKSHDDLYNTQQRLGFKDRTVAVDKPNLHCYLNSGVNREMDNLLDQVVDSCAPGMDVRIVLPKELQFNLSSYSSDKLLEDPMLFIKQLHVNRISHYLEDRSENLYGEGLEAAATHLFGQFNFKTLRMVGRYYNFDGYYFHDARARPMDRSTSYAFSKPTSYLVNSVRIISRETDVNLNRGIEEFAKHYRGNNDDSKGTHGNGSHLAIRCFNNHTYYKFSETGLRAALGFAMAHGSEELKEEIETELQPKLSELDSK